MSSYRATYAKGIVAFAYTGGETMLRVHTGVEPDDIEIDGFDAAIDLPDGRRIVVDLLEGDTMTIERDRAGAERGP